MQFLQIVDFQVFSTISIMLVHRIRIDPKLVRRFCWDQQSWAIGLNVAHYPSAAYIVQEWILHIHPPRAAQTLQSSQTIQILC